MTRARAQPIICLKPAGDAARAAEVLGQDDRIDRIERNNGELHITLRDAGVHHHFLIEKLVAANIPVDSIAPQQLKLEDVFLRLTKGIVQ
jgi:hypothetical protein